MNRSFDHLVLAVDDLDAASEFYEEIGFKLTPRAQHPFGTGNRLVQLQGCFLELLGVTQPEDIPPDNDNVFNFGAYNQDYLTRGQGLSMIVLQTKDAAADRKDFSAEGLETYDLFNFSRLAELPDGSKVTVGFTLAFTAEIDLPESMVFTCQQWRPDLFWKSEYQMHPNGAQAIKEVFLIVDDQAPANRLIKGIKLDPIRGKVSVMSMADFEKRFDGVSAPNGRFGGYSIIVNELVSVRRYMEKNEVPYIDKNASLWITPNCGFGSVIEFTTL